MPNETNTPINMGSSSLAQAPDASVTDEMIQAGMGLGDLMIHTGNAVAQTQSKLNASSAQSATALANTQVDVIAAEEKVYDDMGTLTAVNTHTRKLPLVNFIDPVFYEWSNVRVQGQFFANEFATASSRKSSKYSGSDYSNQSGLLIILGGGGTGVNYKTDSSESTSEYSSDRSVGRIRMNSLLQPRKDVTVPKPRQIVKGPRLSIIHGEIIDVMDGPLITARTMSVLIQYHKRDGAPIANKAVSIETDGAPWSFAGSDMTDASGNIEITLQRNFVDESADRSAANVVISARVGLVQNNSVLTF